MKSVNDEGQDHASGMNSAALLLSARTDVGQIREHNEDQFLVADLAAQERVGLDGAASSQNRLVAVGPEGVLLVVCDGMGGAAAGEIASKMAVDTLFRQMVETASAGLIQGQQAFAAHFVRAVEAAGERIFEESQANRTRRGMGTTMTAACLHGSGLFLAQVGDSRAYVLRSGKLVQVTRDQSLVTQLIESGQLTEEEAETFEHNNIILQALGTADSVQVDLTHIVLEHGDTLLLCSDGLSSLLRSHQICELLANAASPSEACDFLVAEANKSGGHDNITVIVAQFEAPTMTPTENAPLGYRPYPLDSLTAATTIAARASTEPPSSYVDTIDDVRDDFDAREEHAAPRSPIVPPEEKPPESVRAVSHDDEPPRSRRQHADARSVRSVSHDDGAPASVDSSLSTLPPWLAVLIVIAVACLFAAAAALLDG